MIGRFGKQGVTGDNASHDAFNGIKDGKLVDKIEGLSNPTAVTATPPARFTR